MRLSAMSHFLRAKRQAGGDQTLYAFAEIELSAGKHHSGYGASIEVEAEFTQTPVIPARISGPPEDCYPAEGGERELVAVRPIKPKNDGKVEYLDCPEWLAALLCECVDVDALDPVED